MHYCNSSMELTILIVLVMHSKAIEVITFTYCVVLYGTLCKYFWNDKFIILSFLIKIARGQGIMEKIFISEIKINTFGEK